jgi:hypothetical protein
MCMGGGSSASDRYAREQRAAEQARQSRIRQGMGQINAQFSKFTDDFYNQRADAYQRFAMPQLDQQYADASRGLTFALARQGIGQSSEGNRRFGDLQGQFDLNRQGIVDQSLASAADARRAVEDARAGLVSDLYATADPAAANSAALSRAAYLSTPQAPSALGQLFANTLDGLNTYQAYRNDADAYRSALGAYGIGGPGTGSGRNIGGP